MKSRIESSASALKDSAPGILAIWSESQWPGQLVKQASAQVCRSLGGVSKSRFSLVSHLFRGSHLSSSARAMVRVGWDSVSFLGEAGSFVVC